jgi:hypothetical protein
VNPGQEQFFNFLMERIQDEHKNTAKEMMEENFRQQAAGTFTREHMAETQAALIKLLKPQYVAEVKAAMAHFASQMS